MIVLFVLLVFLNNFLLGGDVVCGKGQSRYFWLNVSRLSQRSLWNDLEALFNSISLYMGDMNTNQLRASVLASVPFSSLL